MFALRYDAYTAESSATVLRVPGSAPETSHEGLIDRVAAAQWTPEYRGWCPQSESLFQETRP